jgi:hypothetical protein
MGYMKKATKRARKRPVKRTKSTTSQNPLAGFNAYLQKIQLEWQRDDEIQKKTREMRVCELCDFIYKVTADRPLSPVYEGEIEQIARRALDGGYYLDVVSIEISQREWEKNI